MGVRLTFVCKSWNMRLGAACWQIGPNGADTAPFSLYMKSQNIHSPQWEEAEGVERGQGVHVACVDVSEQSCVPDGLSSATVRMSLSSASAFCQ